MRGIARRLHWPALRGEGESRVLWFSLGGTGTVRMERRAGRTEGKASFFNVAEKRSGCSLLGRYE